jgi:hypothetical protein
MKKEVKPSKRKLKLNKGIFVFLNKNNLTLGGMCKVLVAFAQDMKLEVPEKKDNQWYEDMSDLAQDNFKKFRNVFNKMPTLELRQQTYDEWYQEANMDGSLAYNGVTDDF